MADAAGMVSYDEVSDTPSRRPSRAQLKPATLTQLALMSGSYSGKVIAKQLFNLAVGKGIEAFHRVGDQQVRVLPISPLLYQRTLMMSLLQLMSLQDSTVLLDNKIYHQLPYWAEGFECVIRDDASVVQKLTRKDILTFTSAKMHDAKTVSSQRKLVKREVTKLVAVLRMDQTVRKATGEPTIEQLHGRVLEALWKAEQCPETAIVVGCDSDVPTHIHTNTRAP